MNLIKSSVANWGIFKNNAVRGFLIVFKNYILHLNLQKYSHNENIQGLFISSFMHEFTMDTIARIAMGQVESRQFQNEYTRVLIDTLNGGSRLINGIAWVCPPLGPLCMKLGMWRSYLRQKGEICENFSIF